MVAVNLATNTNGIELLRQLMLEAQVRCHHEGMLFSRLQDVRLAEGMLQVSSNGRPELHIHLSDAKVSCQENDVVVKHDSGKQALRMSFLDITEARSWANAMQNAVSAWDHHHFPVAWPMQPFTELAQLRDQLQILKRKCQENDLRCRQSGDAAYVSQSLEIAEERDRVRSEFRACTQEKEALASQVERQQKKISDLEQEISMQKEYVADYMAATSDVDKQTTQCEILKRELAIASKAKTELVEEFAEEKRKNLGSLELVKEELATATSKFEEERKRNREVEAAKSNEVLDMIAARDALQKEVATLKLEKEGMLAEKENAVVEARKQSELLIGTLRVELAAARSSQEPIKAAMEKKDEADVSTTSELSETPSRKGSTVSVTLPQSVLHRISTEGTKAGKSLTGSFTAAAAKPLPGSLQASLQASGANTTQRLSSNPQSARVLNSDVATPLGQVGQLQTSSARSLGQVGQRTPTQLGQVVGGPTTMPNPQGGSFTAPNIGSARTGQRQTGSLTAPMSKTSPSQVMRQISSGAGGSMTAGLGVRQPGSFTVSAGENVTRRLSTGSTGLTMPASARAPVSSPLSSTRPGYR